MQLNRSDNIKLADKTLFEHYIARRKSMSCEYNFTNLYCWQQSCQTQWTEYDHHLFVWYEREALMLMPMGDFLPPETLAKILSDTTTDGRNWSIYDVPSEYLELYPETAELFNINAHEAEFDYIYQTDTLVNFSGKKLRKKRNLIKQFYRNYPEHRIIPLSTDTHADCLTLAARINHPIPELAAEMQALEYFFAAFDELDGFGTAIYVEDKLIGFSAISQLNAETSCEHFEKIDHAYKGAAQTLVNATAKQLTPDTIYLNREQDMGIAGLRHAKRSYDPKLILKRYSLQALASEHMT